MSWNEEGASQAGAPGVEYLDGLYSYALVLTRNHADAADLVQETYVRALPAMERLRAGSNTKGWLFTILRNVWLNQLRKWRNGPQMVEIEVGDAVAVTLHLNLTPDSGKRFTTNSFISYRHMTRIYHFLDTFVHLLYFLL